MFGLSSEEWQNLVLSVNVRSKKRRLSPVGVARLLRKTLNSANKSDVAEALGFSGLRTFDQILRLSELPEELAELIDWHGKRGTISMYAASELLRLPSDKVPSAIRAAVAYDFTKEEARQVVQTFERSPSPIDIDSCIAEALKTRVRIERSELIIGSVLTTKAQQTIVSLGFEESARKLKNKMAASFPDVFIQSFRLSQGRFNLLISEQDGKKLRSQIGNKSIEQLITDLIETINGG